MALTIASWNVNSVRRRLDGVLRFLTAHGPDVLCLQETKCADAHFPLWAFHDLGYVHHVICGQKGYHGVAVLSRRPIAMSARRVFCALDDSRHVAVTIDGVEIHNFYVPAGGDEPDPERNPKFAHKLAFLREMAQWMGEWNGQERPRVLVGDLNVAPLDCDVWSHTQLLDVVSHTPIEVEHLAAVQASQDWVDAVRVHRPPPEKLYTWWSYRSPNWERSDRGRRLDHVWVSPDLASAVDGIAVLKEARNWDLPSDHVPLLARLDL